MTDNNEAYDRLFKLVKTRVNVRKFLHSPSEATVPGATVTVEGKK